MDTKTTTGEKLLTTEIQWFGKRCLVVCDRQCGNAWGISGSRPQLRCTVDEDDVVWFADDEAGTAPDNPHSYEGGEGKPSRTPEKHNKWCVRQCERSDLIMPGETIACSDWSKRIYNQPWKHGLTENPKLQTAQVFT